MKKVIYKFIEELCRASAKYVEPLFSNLTIIHEFHDNKIVYMSMVSTHPLYEKRLKEQMKGE